MANAENTKKGGSRALRNTIIVIVIAAVIAIGCFWTSSIFQKNTADQGASSVRSAILNAAMQCAAIEGSYPQTLSYLEDNYGVVINHSKYSVSYESFASNMVPSVVVKVK